MFRLVVIIWYMVLKLWIWMCIFRCWFSVLVLVCRWCVREVFLGRLMKLQLFVFFKCIVCLLVSVWLGGMIIINWLLWQFISCRFIVGVWLVKMLKLVWLFSMVSMILVLFFFFSLMWILGLVVVKLVMFCGRNCVIVEVLVYRCMMLMRFEVQLDRLVFNWFMLVRMCCVCCCSVRLVMVSVVLCECCFSSGVLIVVFRLLMCLFVVFMVSSVSLVFLLMLLLWVMRLNSCSEVRFRWWRFMVFDFVCGCCL